MISLELTRDDAALLREQLAIRVRELELDLVHTEKRSLQTEVARDVRRLEHLLEHVAHALTLAESEVAV